MELIKITKHEGNSAVSARELHTFLEVQTKFTTLQTMINNLKV